MQSDIIKLSAPARKGYWEVEVLFEDEHLLALNKPPLLLTSPDRYDRERPNVMKLLHGDITRGARWAGARPGLTYLANAHRLDFETSGVLLLAKSKEVLVKLVDLFGGEKPLKIYVALVRGSPAKDEFQVDAKLAPHPARLGLMRVDPKGGKKSTTDFTVRERFARFSLIECRPRTGRTHQIRVHLRHAGHPIVGDNTYGGRPLLLSNLKSDYRIKGNRAERPLIATTALHAERLSLTHPVTGAEVSITAPWPKDLLVALKYLRRLPCRSASQRPF